MGNWMDERASRLREFLGLSTDARLLAPDAVEPDLPDGIAEQLAYFNIEWHVIPSAEALPMDERYLSRFYAQAQRGFAEPREHALSYQDVLVGGHTKHQGQVIGVETTQKPRYLPGNRQFYGTFYGFDATRDPFNFYLGRANMTNGTRYDHNFLSLREFISVVNEDWRARGLTPKGYRLTICPPAVFNFVGTIFHPEWSETESLELGFYRDEAGNATCYGVGSNAPGDFSYISEVELETDWTLLGFRIALVPEAL
ncbi:MAG TPA: hypothetical protein VJS44_16695 [Pyrinomonadaceae bacterium]|nr:hypothetical protein [Pyrinomonadaceae bacterium]